MGRCHDFRKVPCTDHHTTVKHHDARGQAGRSAGNITIHDSSGLKEFTHGATTTDNPQAPKLSGRTALILQQSTTGDGSCQTAPG